MQPYQSYPQPYAPAPIQPRASTAPGERPKELPWRLAGWWSRVGAQLLDIAIVWIPGGMLLTGLAIAAVAQDPEALRLMAVDPVRIKRMAFGISVALASVAGGALVVVQPVEPSSGQVFIGRVFAVCIMGGMGSLPGCILAAFLFGVVENVTASFYGPSWSPAVAFGWLLVVLAVRPQGLFGRAA